MVPRTETNNETKNQTSQTGDLAGDRVNLSHRYGSIGIQAVAAAARYCNVRSDKPAAAHRIDLRFVESAI